MLNLLKSKGYEGQDNLEEILQWLETKNIYMGLMPSFDEESEELLGYETVYCLKSEPYIKVHSFPHTNYKDALTHTLYQLKDYIW